MMLLGGGGCVGREGIFIFDGSGCGGDVTDG